MSEYNNQNLADSRRNFIKKLTIMLGAGTTSTLLGGNSMAMAMAFHEGSNAALNLFSEQQKRLLFSLCDAVLPKTDTPGGIDAIIHCHCSKCRKNSGTAYATNGFIGSKDLIIKTGQESIKFFETSPGKKRHFCQVCASPIFSSNEQSPDKLRLRLGILDSDIVERPMSHNFVSSKANWDDLDAELPRYEGYEPSRT